MSGEDVRWELASVANVGTDQRKANGLLSEGWEPFAVVAVGVHGSDRMWFRRVVSGRTPASSGETEQP